MTNGVHGWLLLVTAIVEASLIYVFNGIGSALPISDGGSHYLTGLLAYDWLRAPHLSNPMHFCTEYLKHLPWIGLLLWPTLFYGMEMVVFSLFGPTTQVAMINVLRDFRHWRCRACPCRLERRHRRVRRALFCR